jgi:hypothetical protein
LNFKVGAKKNIMADLENLLLEAALGETDILSRLRENKVKENFWIVGVVPILTLVLMMSMVMGVKSRLRFL